MMVTLLAREAPARNAQQVAWFTAQANFAKRSQGCKAAGRSSATLRHVGPAESRLTKARLMFQKEVHLFLMKELSHAAS